MFEKAYRMSPKKRFPLIFSPYILCLLLVLDNSKSGAQHKNESSGKPASVAFEVLSPGYKSYRLSQFNNVFVDSKHSIVKVAAELEGLTGVQLSYSNGEVQKGALNVKFNRESHLLVGVFRDSVTDKSLSYLTSINFGKGKLTKKPLIKNAVTITGLPSVDVYEVCYAKGKHQIKWEPGLFVFLGAVSPTYKIVNANANLPDGRLWEPFIIEGFVNEKPLFEIIGGPDNPVISEGMPGTEGIQGGFEGGACVKIGDTYHMFPTERAGEKGIDYYYDRVKTRIGHWTSKDAIHWKRQSTIYQASGNYALVPEDNPMNDRRGAIWSYMPVFNKEANRWYGYYLAYTVDKAIAPNHSFGRIWRCESLKDGYEGIAGPYKDCGIIMEPGMDSQLWEGRQGVDSFFPYKVGNEWLAFYGGAYPYKKREDYPDKSGKGWFVGLAKSKTMEGPWTRLDTIINPVTSIHPWFIENPIVYQLPNGMFITIFDGGPEAWGHHLPNMIGYSLSNDGYKWSEAHYLPIETKVKKWWNVMRTPLCLIPEGNDIYTVMYAAITSERFHPMGMVKIKLNTTLLNSKAASLKN